MSLFPERMGLHWDRGCACGSGVRGARAGAALDRGAAAAAAGLTWLSPPPPGVPAGPAHHGAVGRVLAQGIGADAGAE